MSQRSPLPPELFAIDHPGGRTQILYVCQIGTINRDQVKSSKASGPDTISDTEGRFNWDGYLDNSNDSEDDSMADVQSDLEDDNGIQNQECQSSRMWVSCHMMWIDSAYTEVNRTTREGVSDGQCNGNEDALRSEENVGHNTSTFHQFLDVSWPRVIVRHRLWVNGQK